MVLPRAHDLQALAVPVEHKRSLSESHQLDDIECIGLFDGRAYRSEVSRITSGPRAAKSSSVSPGRRPAIVEAMLLKAASSADITRPDGMPLFATDAPLSQR